MTLEQWGKGFISAGKTKTPIASGQRIKIVTP
jgi:hypothetical protein